MKRSELSHSTLFTYYDYPPATKGSVYTSISTKRAYTYGKKEHGTISKCKKWAGESEQSGGEQIKALKQELLNEKHSFTNQINSELTYISS